MLLNVQVTLNEMKAGRLTDTSDFDRILQSQVSSSSYLTECKEHRLKERAKAALSPESDQANVECDDDVIMMSSPTPPPKPRMKLLQFHTNVRPAYFGSWSKRSRIVTGRNPFKMDTVS